jgi:hypothetical protein
MIGNSGNRPSPRELPSAKVFNFAQTPPPMQSNLDQFLDPLSQFRPCDPIYRQCGWSSDDLREIVMTKSHAVANVILEAAYFSLAAGVIVFVSLLLLTTIHP